MPFFSRKPKPLDKTVSGLEKGNGKIGASAEDLDYSTLKRDLDKLKHKLDGTTSPDDLLTAASTNKQSPLYATMTALKYGIQPSPPPTDLPSGWQYSWDKERGKYFFYHVGMEKGKGTYIKPTKPISEFKAASNLLASSRGDPTLDQINDVDIKGKRPPPREPRYQRVINKAAADAAAAAAKDAAAKDAAAQDAANAAAAAAKDAAAKAAANASAAAAKPAAGTATANPAAAAAANAGTAAGTAAAVVNAKVKELDDAILKADSDSSNAGKAITAAEIDVAKKNGEYSRLLTAYKDAIRAKKPPDEITAAKTEMDAAKALLDTSKTELKTAKAAKRTTDAALKKAKAAKEAYDNKGKTEKPTKSKGAKKGGTRKLHRKKLTRRRGLRKGPRKTRR